MVPGLTIAIGMEGQPIIFAQNMKYISYPCPYCLP